MRIFSRSTLVAVAVACLMSALPASAQDVVMRRPIPKSQTVTGGASWRTTPWVIYDGSGNAINVQDACGDYVERRTATCVDGSGSPVDEMFCRGIAKPSLERQARHDEGCTYSWDTAAWVDPGPSCSLTETQSRAVTCRRDTDRVVMADSFCSGVKPESTREVEDFATCTYTWTPGAFVDPGPSCTDAETQTRPVDCVRDLDRTRVAEAFCTSAKPAVSQTVRDISACTYSWQTGDFVDPGASCTRSETQTRDVTCHRSLNNELADDSSCNPATRPSNTQLVEDYASCSFNAVQWTAWTPSSTCSATATKTRTAKCQRSNNGGEIVPDALCQAAGVALTETVSEPNYSTCTNSWDRSGFVDPGDNCGDETWTQTVWCKRDLDGYVMPDASCDPTKRPATTEVSHDVTACGYTPTNWSAWSWNSTCSATAVRTRHAQCLRGDGQVVADSECTNRGVSLTQNVTEANYSTCTSSWAQSGFVDPGANCGNETWTQAVTCKRDLDGAVMPDASCSGAKPSTTDVRYDISSCGYAAANWTGWTPSSTCSATATKTRTAQCRRSDGQIVGNAECTSRNVALSETVQEANYSTCTNSWATGSFVDPGANCTATETQTRSVWCKRDLDGAVQPDASCNPAVRPGSTQTVADYSGCGYSAVNWTGWTPSSTCSATATKTRTAQCRRGDGTIVANAECTNRGVAVSETVQEANYSTCTSSWAYGSWADPGASCTAAEPQYRTAWCRRDLDGATMPDTSCNAASREPLSRTVSDYSGCQPFWYAATGWSNWSSTCSTNATRTREIGCFRGESNCTPGTPGYWDDWGNGNCVRKISNAECQAYPTATREGFSPSNGTETAAIYSSCSNSWDYSAFADPGASCGNETWTRTARCRRDLDNATMPDSSCGPRDSLTDVRYDVSGCGYDRVNPSAWSFNSTCSATATKTRTYQCRRGDGQIVADAECTNRGISLSESATEANYSTCSNSWARSGFVDPGANCGYETWTQSVWCKRDLDGAVQPDSSCNAGTRPSSTEVAYDVSACGYSAVNWSGWNWNSTCSANAVRTRTAQCRRGDGQIVADAECTNRGVALSESVQEANYSTCTSNWAAGGWSDPGASCTVREQQTRAVWCRRDVDGAAMPDSSCNAGTRPTSSQQVADYSGCSPYYYSATGWSNWSSTCSSNATRTREIGCFRNETDCRSTDQYFWGFHNPGVNNDCSKRIPDGNCSMPSSGWAGYSPASGSETAAVYSTCGYSAVNWTAWNWNSQCSSNATRTRTAQCQRSDGTIVANAECTNRGVALSESVTEANYSQCTYSASNTQTSCSSGTQTVNWTCTRNQTGEQVSQGYCGVPAQSSQACTSYSWQAGGWGGFDACQPNGVQYQYRDVYCEANNGGNRWRVDNSLCGGGAPSNVNGQGCTYYTYQSDYGPWTDWNSHCSHNATRTRDVACHAVNNGNYTRVADSECTNRGIAMWSRSETSAVYDGCGYTASYGDWSACQPDNTQVRGMTLCTRSIDGASVAGEECVNRGQPWQQTQGCSYTTTTHEQRDYDGWSNGQRMCSRFYITNWFCDGYSTCTISNIRYVTNTNTVCNVEADVTHGPLDGYQRRPIAPSVGEFGY